MLNRPLGHRLSSKVEMWSAIEMESGKGRYLGGLMAMPWGLRERENRRRGIRILALLRLLSIAIPSLVEPPPLPLPPPVLRHAERSSDERESNRGNFPGRIGYQAASDDGSLRRGNTYRDRSFTRNGGPSRLLIR